MSSRRRDVGAADSATRGVDDAPQLTGAEQAIRGTDVPDDERSVQHTIEYDWDAEDQSHSSDYGWHCSCGASSGDRCFDSFEAAEIAARRHLSARLNA